MSFYTAKERKEFKTFNAPIFFKATPGTHTVRILDSEAKTFYVHWINGTSILCLGDDCPQCEQNKKIIVENPKAFRDVKGYSSKQERNMVNILDKTLVKVCPQCSNENASINDVFLPQCQSCGAMLINVNPIQSNKVKIFSSGTTVFSLLASLDKSKNDANGEPLGITNYDINIMVVGKNSVPMATDNMDKVDVPEDALYDLDNVIIKLSREEMLQRMRGVSLKDLFAARKAVVEDSSSTVDTEELEKEIIDELFSE